jgi:hypothetical protein
LSRRSISLGVCRWGLKFSAHLSTWWLPVPQRCLAVWTAPSHPACPWSLILLSSRPLSLTGNALSLIGIEIHCPPFSCRWGFHRKKLLLCFPSLVTISCFTGSSLSWTSARLSLLKWTNRCCWGRWAPLATVPQSDQTSQITSNEDGFSWDSCLFQHLLIMGQVCACRSEGRRTGLIRPSRKHWRTCPAFEAF